MDERDRHYVLREFEELLKKVNDIIDELSPRGGKLLALQERITRDCQPQEWE